MSQSTVSGIVNLKLQQFLDRYSAGPHLRKIEWGPGTTNGTFVTVEDSRGRRAFYLITDLTPVSFDKIIADGQVTVTIAAGAQTSPTSTVATNLNIAGKQTLKSAFASITNGVISGSGELVSVQAQVTGLLGGSVLISASRGPLLLNLVPVMPILDATTGGFEWDGSSASKTDATANGFGAQLSVAVNWAAIGSTP